MSAVTKVWLTGLALMVAGYFILFSTLGWEATTGILLLHLGYMVFDFATGG